MPKISDLDYVSEIDATSYLLGVKGGATVRFPASVLQGEDPVVNTTFIGQGDTPDSYAGQAGKMAAVNEAEDALEFIDAPTSLPSGGATGQVLTKNSATDGDAGWAESSGGTEITAGTTPPASPIDGQLWIDETQGVQDQNNFLDVTNFTADYPLRRGETAVVNYSAATSVPLNIKVVEGMYEIGISNLSNTSMGTTANVALEPNNTTYTSAFRESFVDSRAGSLNNTSLSRFIFAQDMILASNLQISTKAYSKTILIDTAYKKVNGEYAARKGMLFWDDTNAWTSLGMIRFAFAQSGTIIIRRIY